MTNYLHFIGWAVLPTGWLPLGFYAFACLDICEKF